MNEAASPEHGTHAAPASGQPYFPDAEWQALQTEDILAGKAVVGLMVGIFSIGLLLYIGVALFVRAWPHS